ncbi:hypothetical protein MnTg04_00638 [bacterium MnTg04]|nr:hypothetical protein MnTg04_00638 [bacterium MnTg04]
MLIHDLIGAGFALRDHCLQAFERRAGVDIGKIFFHQRTRLGGIDVAGQDQHRVGRAIILAEPLLDVIERSGVEILHRPDRAPAIGVSHREQAFQRAIFDPAVGLIVALAFLVLHDAALLIEFFLGYDAEQMPHAVGFHPQRHFQRRGRDVLEVVGAVEPGRPVHRGGADFVKWFEILVVVIFRAVEHQVFEKMGKTGLARFFVL